MESDRYCQNRRLEAFIPASWIFMIGAFANGSLGSVPGPSYGGGCG